MQFQYFAGKQRTPEWYALRRGKITASRLEDWLSVSKAKSTLGQPLEKRKAYERELMYERQFNVSYNNYVTDAMLDGVELERFAAEQYELHTGRKINECGAWYNDYFVASPDGVIVDGDATGLAEIKLLRDNKFSQVLSAGPKDTHAVPDGDKVDAKGKPVLLGTGVIEEHWKQIQGQLWASSAAWCDYIALNTNTMKGKIIRVLPDLEFHEWLELAIQEPLSVEPFSQEGLFDVVGDLPLLPGAPTEQPLLQGGLAW